MKLVPVIDLLDGVVVHARGGLRSAYRPIRTPLCDDSDAVAVVAALAALYRFDCLYVADLDAIQGRGDHGKVLERMVQAFPGLQFWIDAGPVSLRHRDMDPDRIRPVLGSESLDKGSSGGRVSARTAQTASGDGRPPAPDSLQGPGSGDWILSLDFDGGGLRGDAALLDDPALWPGEVILMELQRVGTGSGPNWLRIEQYCRDHPNTAFYAAGGVRGDGDLRQLERLGAGGALLASALHAGTIKSYRIHL